ncbi:MAG: dihydroorotase [Gammaproteobacteria bacterium]|nr:dihydroorotase [Gammaproteobacteria bacterium]
MMKLTITQPDDWHLHVRDGEFMSAVLPFTAARFARAVIMPNLQPPVTSVAAALSYRERVIAAADAAGFTPLMTLYLTPSTSVETIEQAAACPHIIGVKWYPAGATTHSDQGVSDISDCLHVVEAMSELSLPLLIHGEVTDPEVDIFDRESRFVTSTLEPLLQRVPELRVVLEHITTADSAQFVQDAGPNVAATITPQHLQLNRTAMFQGGLRPHHYCLPVLKREYHRRRLVEVATSGDPKFFLGTDSAPHLRKDKESACGCAGVFSAHAGIELYAEVFDNAGALDRLEGFASLHGAAFYGLDRNSGTLTLERRAWQVPDVYRVGADELVPFRAGTKIAWRVHTSEGEH